MQDLERVIRKALNNGWKIPFEEPILNIKIAKEPIGKVPQVTPYVLFELDGPTDWAAGIPHIIFDHDFAKALWGEVELSGLDLVVAQPDMFTGATGATHHWRYHLQQMVIADDRIKYLSENA